MLRKTDIAVRRMTAEAAQSIVLGDLELRILANLLAQTQYHGAIAACGLAQGMDLPTTVAPFILRGVSLLGVDSVMCPMAKRVAAWDRLARDLDGNKLAAMTTTIRFDEVIDTAKAILDGKVRGRVVVEIE